MRRTRIAAALARVAPHSGNAPQAYFLGFAGDGEERVFEQEVKLAAAAIGRRYGTVGHSLLLINDERDLDSQPLATVAGLELALKGLAAKMDPRQDILFLVLSSHGSDDPLLAVSNAGMPLNQLDAQAVASALDDAGIRHRVIIISACYAGAFIPSLRNEDTIILTAAAADRTSFGCGSDRELTYFGEALFRDTLPRAAGLTQAFEQAARALAARETAEHETPSHPQAFYGAQMIARLTDFERRHHPPPEAGNRP
ncbi:MAG: caspase family protein [Proteobacteria bacterium]|nr:caspase family protein [Pseudomonadota bacterium]